MNEDGETPLFEENFPDWPVANAQVGMGQVHKKERIACKSEGGGMGEGVRFKSKTVRWDKMV